MSQTLQRGDPAPDFELPSTQGPQSLHMYRGQWVVLYFYPKDDTPGCTTEACDFRDRSARLKDLTAVVLGVSPDSLESHERFAAAQGLGFPLLSDEDRALTRAYGAWGEKTNYGKTSEGVIRSTFIIDPEGRVAEAMVNVTATGHAERVAQRLTELQAALAATPGA